jgi:hypothetical protein
MVHVPHAFVVRYVGTTDSEWNRKLKPFRQTSVYAMQCTDIIIVLMARGKTGVLQYDRMQGFCNKLCMVNSIG